MRISAMLSIAAMAAGVLFVAAQTTPRPSFEVASIKPYADSAGPVFYGYRLAPGSPRLTFSGVTAKELLKYAYRINDFQIIGGPDWINSLRYDIEAKAEDGSVTRKDFSDPVILPEPFAVRIQSLLDERFHLKMHRETRDLQVYELLIAGGGSRMTLSSDQSPLSLPEPGDPGKPLVPPQQFRGAIAPRCSLGGCALEGTGIPMFRFINSLSMQLGRPIVDRANLGPGLYDINLRWSGTPSTGATPENADAPSIFTALREQLGLRLATAKGPVEVFVIESVQKPTPN